MAMPQPVATSGNFKRRRLGTFLIMRGSQIPSDGVSATNGAPEGNQLEPVKGGGQQSLESAKPNPADLFIQLRRSWVRMKPLAAGSPIVRARHG